jgi:hypothetical protein
MDKAYTPEKHYADKSEKFAEKYPHHHQTFFNRPDVTRRRFFRVAGQVAGAGLAGSFLAGRAKAFDSTTSAGVPLINTAKNTIFILLTARSVASIHSI